MTDGAAVAALFEVTVYPLTRPFADVTAERGVGASGAETTVAEQFSLLPGAALWNAAASFEDGVGAVRLRTAESEWSTFPFGFDTGRVAFRLRGETYRATLDRDP